MFDDHSDRSITVSRNTIEYSECPTPVLDNMNSLGSKDEDFTVEFWTRPSDLIENKFNLKNTSECVRSS